MRRSVLLLISLFLALPAFSNEPKIRSLLVRYKGAPTVGRVLAAPAAPPAGRMRSAAAMAQFSAASSILSRTAVVDIPANAEVNAELAKWNARPDVEFVEPNYPMRVSFVPNDTRYNEQWALKNTGQAGGNDSYDPGSGTAGSDIGAEDAWDIEQGSNTIVVAVIDAGINVAHADLAANMLSGKDFGDDDNNPDDNCFNATPAFNARGHGTHVTGIIGAVGNNSVGVTGLHFGGKIMPLKVANSNCEILTDAVVDAIVYASTAGAHVINMSLGGENSVALSNAINTAEAAGIVMVAAAGNEGTEDFTFSYPAANSKVIAVAATDRTDHLSGYSNRGTWITISAPGTGILSTFPTTVQASGYGYLSGTSMASPMVAGAAALLLSDNPSLTAAQVRARLLSTADNINALNPSYVGKIGAGRLNISNALFSISSVSPSSAPNSGSLAITTVTLTGFGFAAGMTATLERGTQTITGTGLGVSTVTTSTVTFNVTGRPGGRWDVVLEKSGGGTTRLTEGFRVLSPTFNSISIAPSVSTTTTIQTVQGTTNTVVWPVGVATTTVVLDVDGSTAPIKATSVDPLTSLLTGTGIELKTTPAQTNLSVPVTLTIGYRQGDLFNPANESSLVIARYDTVNLRWKPLSSVVDAVNNTVTAQTDHLSTFAILQATAAINLSRALAYPNPFRAELGHSRIVFSFLTAGAQVRIYDVAGGLVRDLTDENGDGQIYWDGVKNDSGEDVASGIYFYLITDPDGRKEKGRLGVVR